MDTAKIVGLVTARRVKLPNREAGGSCEIHSIHRGSAQDGGREVGGRKDSES